MSAENIPLGGKRSVRFFALERLKKASAIIGAFARFGWGARSRILRKQIKRHMAHWDLDNAVIVSHHLVPAISGASAKRDGRVLAVGCCNMLEIYTFWSYGFRDVVGIDLVSHGRHILAMDMHEIHFSDDCFDVLYCAGAFHCTHDPQALAAEFLRVVRNGGLIALSLPVNYPTDEIYRLDVKSLQGIEELFAGHIHEVLLAQAIPPESPLNPNAAETLRMVFRVQK